MNDLAVKQLEIDMKLQREMSNLAVLQDSLQKSQQLTGNMVGILTTFENRLKKLEETIVPVYHETENLQQRHQNIEKTIAELDHVIGFYHVAKEVENIIRESPSSDLHEYLLCLEKLQKAVDYFTDQHPGSSELSAVTMLFDQGRQTLETEFRDLLLRNSKPTPSAQLIDILAQYEESPEEESPHIEHLEKSIVHDLAEISKWLAANSSSADFANVYATVRCNTLIKALQGLREHQKALAGGGGGTATLGPGLSPALSSKFRHSGHSRDIPTSGKRASVKRTLLMARKASQALMKYSQQTLESVSGHKRQSSATPEIKEEATDVDIETYISIITALLKLMQSENQLMQLIIPDKHQRKTFDILIQPALESIVTEGEQLAASVRRAIAHHDYPSVLQLFPVVRHLRSIKPEYDVSLEGCQAPTRSKLASLITTLDATGAKALEEFIERIRNDPDKASNMPKDGTVHELTSNTLNFLEQLMEYTDAAGAMLLIHDPAGHTLAQDPKKKATKVAEYTTKVLSALGLNLSNKAETYSDVTLRAVFMLNNYNYLLKTMKRNGLLSLVHSYNKEVETYYNEQILEQKKLYSQSFSRILHYIMEVHKPISQHYVQSPDLAQAKLKDKDKQNIKDKFAGFNKEMEELRKIQKSYAIPDSELRENLKQDNKDFILPKYEMFWKKYVNTNFTKNPEKYMKYTKDEVETMLDGFFDYSS
ncbi:exocyst complex component 7 [Lingula anatina]|uniref:Exocyst complex component 7 n=1 Tax=Lingula anatina TaxID=7574 RepID=A0A1S3IE79_LINAN|nr:exocyst complex component 7 [Lingula anatina]|eukprot:XP_013396537.1 exocyst complex component 7 [Lingula anatina]